MELTNTFDFQTPIWCCNYMMSLIPQGTKTVLEPTPGAGNLVNQLKTKYDVISPDGDFFNFNLNKYDCCVMNPPFTPMVLGYQIFYRCMESSDSIIALMPWLTLINSAKRIKDIFDFGLISVTHLPRNTFPGSRVQTCIMNMSKGHSGTSFYSLELNKDFYSVR